MAQHKSSTRSTTSCGERKRLAATLTKAIQNVFQTKAADERARGSGERNLTSAALAEARKQEHAAMAALEKHRKDHGC